jgi:hypothetical protein
MSRFISASVLAVTVLASSAAFGFSTVHPTQQQLPALNQQIKQQVASKLGATPGQVTVKDNLNPKEPRGFIGNGFATWTATAKVNGQKRTVTGYFSASPSGGFNTPQVGGVTTKPTIGALMKSTISKVLPARGTNVLSVLAPRK